MPRMPCLDLLPIFRGHGLSPSLSTPSHCEKNSEGLSLGQLGVSPDGLGNQNHVKKVKLKFGAVTRTIHADPAYNGASRSRSTANSSRSTNTFRSHEKQQSNSDNNHSPFDKRSELQGLPLKDFSEGDFVVEKEETLMGRTYRKNTSKEGDKFKSIRKSKQVPRRRVLDGKFSDTDYEDDEEPGSDVELEDKKKEKQGKESVDVLMDSKRKMTLTRRQQALLSSKDASASSASLIEFPNGLPPAPTRKQKEKLSEMKQQQKKAEAAQKCRMQVEKAARESEAEAIRKILGQDSSRKKREEKVKKRQEELAKEKASNAQILASSTIRYVMGPTRTTVTFPEEMEFPSIFNSKPLSYPPPHEKCAGTCCTNPYKYRDSKYLFAVSNATRLYMKRWRLKLPLPLPLDVAKDPLSLAYASGTLDGFLSWAFGRDLILEM